MCDCLYDVMSITKAAIGTIYHIHQNLFPRNNKLEFTTIGKALNMRAGKADNSWDFNNFRDHVEGDADLRKYAVYKLHEAEDVDGMDYSNLTYQLLASNMRDVADRFGQMMGDPAGKELVRETSWNNKDVYFKKGKEWKWEHTKSGEPLGPHGLYMTQAACKRFGELAKPHVLGMSAEEKEPVQWWNGIGKEQFTHYWNGWFLTANNAYAVGYVVQVIALTPSGVLTQIYEEDWGPDGLGMEKYPNHPRWKFIKNIEYNNKLKF